MPENALLSVCTFVCVSLFKLITANQNEMQSRNYKSKINENITFKILKIEAD